MRKPRDKKENRKPVCDEKPHWIGQSFPDDDAPGFRHAQHGSPRHRAFHIGVHVSGAWSCSIREPEQDQPQKPETSGNEEYRTPASERMVGPEDQRGCNRRTCSRATVVKRDSPSALARGEPLGDNLRRTRPVARFSQTEKKPKGAEAAKSRGQRGKHRCGRVEQDGDTQPLPRADPIEKPAHSSLADRVRDSERDDKQREVRVRPLVLSLDERREDAQCLTVNVVDDRRKKKEDSDVPAQRTALLALRQLPAFIEKAGVCSFGHVGIRCVADL